MIRPPGDDGAAFTGSSEGDVRDDGEARRTVSRSLGVRDSWAVAHQVHGSEVVRVDVPGLAGEADAVWTSETGLPVAVFTADCLGIVLSANDAVGVAHAGWRGAAEGVVGKLRQQMTAAGHPPRRAAIGPGIGACCFEVGAEVAERFEDRHVSRTTWDTTSVDLAAVVGDELGDLSIWVSRACTLHDPGWFSHRRDGRPERMAAIGWVP